ncbi:MAG TPA: terminase, partial [Micromonosporaceae bacterium]|nr:terminase [Micromonosporaceae bacterium]
MQTPALDILDQCVVDAEQGINPWFIFTMPPQEGKSQRVSRFTPTKVLVRNPDLRIAIVSYADALARRWGRVVRNDIREHPELGLTIRADTGAANEWQIDGYDGGIITAGIGS